MERKAEASLNLPDVPVPEITSAEEFSRYLDVDIELKSKGELSDAIVAAITTQRACHAVATRKTEEEPRKAPGDQESPVSEHRLARATLY